MKRVFRTAVSLMGLLMLLASQAVAAEKATFVVMPFSIQGPQGFAYLERSIPQMLTSRLYWKGRVEPVVQDLPAGVKPVTTDAAAEKARVQYGADYVVWGTVTVVGDDCSLDIRVRNKAGKVWPQSRDTKATQLIAAIKVVSDNINREVFGRSGQSGESASSGKGRVNQMNPDVMMNETSDKDVYLNPQFRYSGASAADDSRLRSQALPFTAIGMEVLDANGDGKNEIVLLSEYNLYAYSFENGQLKPIAEFQFPRALECLTLRALPRSTGKPWLIVNMIDDKGLPKSSILTLNGNQFVEEMKNVKYFLNVVKLPPDHMPVLIGQEAQPPRLFRPGVINEMAKQGDSLVPGKGIALPKDANVLNFTYLPGGRDERDGEKLIVLSEAERLRTYTTKGARLAESPEKYSGSAVGFEMNAAMRGMGKERVTIGDTYYMPMRMVPIDLEHDGNYELLVNKPISTASEIFDRYRFFPQSEIHSLFWDGVGMNLQWKTRRIKGSVVDFAVSDANNDGITDLVTCLNTHPGALGAKARKTIVVLYPLDLDKTNPGTAPSKSDIYE